MSINVRVLPVSDEQFAKLAADPSRLARDEMTDPAAELYDNWRNLDYLLGGQSFLVTGDVQLKDSTNEPAHAIRSARVPALAAQLDGLSDGDIRDRLGAEAMRSAGMRVSQYHTVDNMLRDILPAMHQLRTAVVRAAAEERGLVVWRYEWV